MISTEFAPNERWSDALLSLGLLVQPWKWHSGRGLNDVQTIIAKEFAVSPGEVTLTLSGRAALYHILNSLQLEKGSEVLVTGFTCEAVVLPVIELGYKPVYVDIDTETYSMNPAELEKKISSKSKVLILQHTFGILPHRSSILSLAKKHNLTVIEDLAHGWSRGEVEGTDTIKLLSFGRSKSLSSVFGGAVIANSKIIKTLNDVLYKERFPSLITMKRLLMYKPLVMTIKSSYGLLGLGKVLHKLITATGLLIPEISAQEKRGVYDPFFDKRYPNALAVLLLHQWKRFNKTTKHRSTIYDVYKKKLNLPGKGSYALARVPVLVNEKQPVINELKQYNIAVGKWYEQPVAPKEVPLDKMNYTKGECAVSERVCKHIVNLPTNVTIEEANSIAEIVKDKIIL